MGCVQDKYDMLSYKTMALWKVVEEEFNVQYLVKVDDDNYVRLDRLALAFDQWTGMGAGAPPPLSELRKNLLPGLRHLYFFHPRDAQLSFACDHAASFDIGSYPASGSADLAVKCLLR
jgi:hypothetical protein